MKTKNKAQRTESLPDNFRRVFDSNGRFVNELNLGHGSYTSGPETITYSEGPMKSNGHCNWKQCTHTAENARHIVPTVSTARYYDPYYHEYVEYFMHSISQINVSYKPTAPKGDFDPSVIANVLNQVDLNTSDSVLLYSGVVQAIPLLGGILKFNSLFNRLAKQISKDLRKRPFTSVVKYLIQKDFIERFVVAPTIADAQKFADATNYVLRVIETARSRNATPTALSAESVKTLSSKQTSGSTSTNFGYLDWSQIERKSLTSKAFAYLDVRYDISAIDPIRFWANRVGLTRPLDSAWDLVPFSFVIDYFTRAGDFISGLSDKMSSMDGLVGKVGKIHGFWGTFKREHTFERSYLGFTPGRMQGLGDPISVDVQNGSASISSYYFSRFPISDPYSWLNRLEKDNGFVSVNLSPVRARTIVELLIQAKL